MNFQRTLMLGGLAAIGAAGQDAAAADRDNLVLIVADDCGWYDIGCFGAKNNRTPNIDAIAAKGIKFNNAFNSVSTSVPTRHCLYTGMYPIHNGGHYNLSAISDGVKTMPVRLSELGYRVGLAGKCHIQPKEAFPFEKVPGFPVNCLTKDPKHTMDGIEEFISRDDSRPFCLVVASTCPHVPWTGGDPSKYDPDSLVLPPHFADTPELRKNYTKYLAEMDVLDQEVGDVLKALEERGLMDNTMVVFVSEQGSQLTGGKWTNWSAGVKSAMVARWDGHIVPGTETDAIVQYEDILPTFMEIAGGKPGKTDMDGRSIVKLLEGDKDSHRKYAFHLHNNYPSGPVYPIRAVSDGRFRLIWNMTPDKRMVAKNMENEPWLKEWRASDDPDVRRIVDRWYTRPEFELYDTAADPWEMDNIADKPQYRKTREKLLKELKKWMSQQHDSGIAADNEHNKPYNKKAREYIDKL